MSSFCRPFLIALLLVLCSQSVVAQSKVVVIPLLGEDGPQYRGTWDIDIQYKESDVVEEGGSSYIALINHTSSFGTMPGVDTEVWGLVAASGAAGATGELGAKGDTGDPGPKGDTGEAGSQGADGDKGDKGDKGDEGDEGNTGAVGATGPTKFDACKDINGVRGVIFNGVCILSYDNSLSTNWSAAVTACSAKGGDLCSTSQYSQLREASGTNNDLFFNSRRVWSEDFSDNDGGNKTPFLHSSDDPNQLQLASYACCGILQAEPYRSSTQLINGIRVSWAQATSDTTFTAAAQICTSLGSDLCSKSQYVSLRDDGLSSTALWTKEMSDNDSGNFGAIVGAGVSDNSLTSNLYGFACCSSSLPLDYSCPNGTVLATTGICITETNAAENANFFTAARACAAKESDLCSKSQTTIIRSLTPSLAAVELWTNDGADNDATRAGGLLSTQADNPDPSSDQMGYVCCR